MKSLRISCIRQNKGIFWVVLILMTMTVFCLSLWVGSVSVPLKELLSILLGGDITSVNGKIVFYTRLPRACGAILAGSALAVSGVVIQTVLNNPLASPGVIGVNSGAGLAVAVACAIMPMAQQYVSMIAFLGAFFSVMLVMGLSHMTGASRMTVILAGVAISNLFSAGIDGVVTLFPDALCGVTDFRIGGLYGVTMEQILPSAGMILIGIGILLSLSQQLDILSLGTDIAGSLGLAVNQVRMLLLILAAALTGAAVSFSGLIGFVGLVVPHAMRRILGEESSPLLVGSALGGALFMLVCDLIARTLFSPFELPVGIVLSFAGGPFFLWLLFHQKGGRP